LPTTTEPSGTWRVSKRFRFEAAHHLPHLPAGHKCARPHGHSYQVELHLSATALDARGFVIDYGDLDAFKRWLDTHMDHQDLNVVMGGTKTTAEEIARYLYEVACELVLPWNKRHRVGLPPVTLDRVVVRETESTTGEYIPGPAPGG
jgi:6-pyruvoyltetrahydropterin/6-carboxytetrahydropterin synthase